MEKDSREKGGSDGKLSKESYPAGSANPLPVSTRVLIIDDDPSFLQMAKVLARRKGVEVETVGSGAEAERLLGSRSFDLVFCDYFMPGETGGELYLNFIQWQPELADRFVLMTGDSVTCEVADRFRHLGLRCVSKVFFYEAMDGFLVSPSAGHP